MDIIIDAIEMANDEWNQYLDIEKMDTIHGRQFLNGITGII